MSFESDAIVEITIVCREDIAIGQKLRWIHPELDRALRRHRSQITNAYVITDSIKLKSLTPRRFRTRCRCDRFDRFELCAFDKRGIAGISKIPERRVRCIGRIAFRRKIRN